jgi:hypothetical protein
MCSSSSPHNFTLLSSAARRHRHGSPLRATTPAPTLACHSASPPAAAPYYALSLSISVSLPPPILICPSVPPPPLSPFATVGRMQARATMLRTPMTLHSHRCRCHCFDFFFWEIKNRGASDSTSSSVPLSCAAASLARWMNVARPSIYSIVAATVVRRWAVAPPEIKPGQQRCVGSAHGASAIPRRSGRA